MSLCNRLNVCDRIMYWNVILFQAHLLVHMCSEEYPDTRFEPTPPLDITSFSQKLSVLGNKYSVRNIRKFIYWTFFFFFFVEYCDLIQSSTSFSKTCTYDSCPAKTALRTK